MKFQYNLAVSLFSCERKKIAKIHRIGRRYEHFTKDTEVANMHLKKCSSCIFREMQIKQQLDSWTNLQKVLKLRMIDYKKYK